MALGQFVAPQGNFIPSTKFDVKDNLGKPLIVIVREYNPEFSTEAYPEPRGVVFVMIAELSDVVKGGPPKLYANALLGGTAVADRLKKYAGAVDEEGNPVKLPVKLGTGTNRTTGRKYQTIEPLEGAELKFAALWDEKNPTALQDERARLQAIADAEAEQKGNSPAASSNGAGSDFDDDAIAKAIAAMSS